MANHPSIFTVRTHEHIKGQYFGHLIRTDDSLEKSLMLRKIERRRRYFWLLLSSTNSIFVACNQRAMLIFSSCSSVFSQRKYQGDIGFQDRFWR